MTAAALAPAFTSSALVALWTKHLRDTDGCQHSHDWSRADGSAQDRVLCEPAKRVSGDTTELTPQWTFQRRNTRAPVSVREPQTHLFTPQLRSGLGYSTATTGEQTPLMTGRWQPQSTGAALPAHHLVQAHHHHARHTLGQGGSGLHAEERRGRHPHTASPQTPNTETMQSPQGCTHVNQTFKTTFSTHEWSEVAQSCPALCDPMDHNLAGSSVHGIFQAKVLEWVAISFSRGSSWPGIESRSPALWAAALLSEPLGRPLNS